MRETREKAGTAERFSPKKIISERKKGMVLQCTKSLDTAPAKAKLQKKTKTKSYYRG